ncbi:unnamed protein product [Porites lobata]|uniref:Complex I-B15 n=1 Tax=Porites lobata TaxID=104759 RepID=A0ABN8PQH7_9CNID|nr:unnamed protein product [Porites lobata]
MAGGRYAYPYGPSPTDESLKLRNSKGLNRPCLWLFSQAKYATEYKATGKWKPPEQCSELIKDPSIERFGWIRENPDIYFKWKPRTVRNGLIFMVAIPGALLYFLKKMEQRRDVQQGKPPRPLI